MTAAGPFPLRTLAFGDLDSGLWGAVWSHRETVALISHGGAEPVSVVLAGTGGEPGQPWRLEGEGVELEAAPEVGVSAPEEQAFVAELCRVSGRIAVAPGEWRTVAVPGLRTGLQVDPLQLDSFRQVLAWFAPADALTLAAARPSGSAGHERDRVSAAVLEPDGPATVDEGRLSTTYAGDGSPARTTIELWLVSGEQEYPRRAAGEATGAAGRAETAGIALEVRALRCHRGGADGTGAYLLARPR